MEAYLAVSAPICNSALQHSSGSSEKDNVAAQNPEKLAELQKRANELAAIMVKPLLLETEIKMMLQRLAMPPSLPGEEFEFNEEQ